MVQHKKSHRRKNTIRSKNTRRRKIKIPRKVMTGGDINNILFYPGSYFEGKTLDKKKKMSAQFEEIIIRMNNELKLKDNYISHIGSFVIKSIDKDIKKGGASAKVCINTNSRQYTIIDTYNRIVSILASQLVDPNYQVPILDRLDGELAGVNITALTQDQDSRITYAINIYEENGINNIVISLHLFRMIRGRPNLIPRSAHITLHPANRTTQSWIRNPGPSHITVDHPPQPHTVIGVRWKMCAKVDTCPPVLIPHPFGNVLFSIEAEDTTVFNPRMSGNLQHLLSSCLRPVLDLMTDSIVFNINAPPFDMLDLQTKYFLFDRLHDVCSDIDYDKRTKAKHRHRINHGKRGRTGGIEPRDWDLIEFIE